MQSGKALKLEKLNGLQPLLILLITPVAFLLCEQDLELPDSLT